MWISALRVLSRGGLLPLHCFRGWLVDPSRHLVGAAAAVVPPKPYSSSAEQDPSTRYPPRPPFASQKSGSSESSGFRNGLNPSSDRGFGEFRANNNSIDTQAPSYSNIRNAGSVFDGYSSNPNRFPDQRTAYPSQPPFASDLQKGEISGSSDYRHGLTPSYNRGFDKFRATNNSIDTQASVNNNKPFVGSVGDGFSANPNRFADPSTKYPLQPPVAYDQRSEISANPGLRNGLNPSPGRGFDKFRAANDSTDVHASTNNDISVAGSIRDGFPPNPNRFADPSTRYPPQPSFASNLQKTENLENFSLRNGLNPSVDRGFDKLRATGNSIDTHASINSNRSIGGSVHDGFSSSPNKFSGKASEGFLSSANKFSGRLSDDKFSGRADDGFASGPRGGFGDGIRANAASSLDVKDGGFGDFGQGNHQEGTRSGEGGNFKNSSGGNGGWSRKEFDTSFNQHADPPQRASQGKFAYNGDHNPAAGSSRNIFSPRQSYHPTFNQGQFPSESLNERHISKGLGNARNNNEGLGEGLLVRKDAGYGHIDNMHGNGISQEVRSEYKLSLRQPGPANVDRYSRDLDDYHHRFHEPAQGVHSGTQVGAGSVTYMDPYAAQSGSFTGYLDPRRSSTFHHPAASENRGSGRVYDQQWRDHTQEYSRGSLAEEKGNFQGQERYYNSPPYPSGPSLSGSLGDIQVRRMEEDFRHNLGQARGRDTDLQSAGRGYDVSALNSDRRSRDMPPIRHPDQGGEMRSLTEARGGLGHISGRTQDDFQYNPGQARGSDTGWQSAGRDFGDAHDLKLSYNGRSRDMLPFDQPGHGNETRGLTEARGGLRYDQSQSYGGDRLGDAVAGSQNRFDAAHYGNMTSYRRDLESSDGYRHWRNNGTQYSQSVIKEIDEPFGRYTQEGGRANIPSDYRSSVSTQNQRPLNGPGVACDSGTYSESGNETFWDRRQKLQNAERDKAAYYDASIATKVANQNAPWHNHQPGDFAKTESQQNPVGKGDRSGRSTSNIIAEDVHDQLPAGAIIAKGIQHDAASGRSGNGSLDKRSSENMNNYEAFAAQPQPRQRMSREVPPSRSMLPSSPPDHLRSQDAGESLRIKSQNFLHPSGPFEHERSDRNGENKSAGQLNESTKQSEKEPTTMAASGGSGNVSLDKRSSENMNNYEDFASQPQPRQHMSREVPSSQTMLPSSPPDHLRSQDAGENLRTKKQNFLHPSGDSEHERSDRNGETKHSEKEPTKLAALNLAHEAVPPKVLVESVENTLGLESTERKSQTTDIPEDDGPAIGKMDDKTARALPLPKSSAISPVKAQPLQNNSLGPFSQPARIVFARLQNVPRLALKSDIMQYFGGLSIQPDDLTVVYDERYQPLYTQIRFNSVKDMRDAQRLVSIKGRLGGRFLKIEPNVKPVEDNHSGLTPAMKRYLGRMLLVVHFPKDGTLEDLLRFFEGYSYDQRCIFHLKSIYLSTPRRKAASNQPNVSFARRVMVGFTSALEALRALREKQGDFCLYESLELKLIQ